MKTLEVRHRSSSDYFNSLNEQTANFAIEKYIRYFKMIQDFLRCFCGEKNLVGLFECVVAFDIQHILRRNMISLRWIRDCDIYQHSAGVLRRFKLSYLRQ